MRSVPRIATGQAGVFTTAQALAAGWTMSALRHAVGRGSLVRVRSGVYAVTVDGSGDPYGDDELQLRRAAVAVGLTHRRMTVSHRSAASLRRLPIVHPTTTPCVTYPRPLRGRVRGAHLHRAPLRDGDVTRMAGVYVTSTARTVVDLGRELGADDGVAAADAALRRGATTATLLDEALRRCTGWPGVRAAAHAVAHADARAESALESISRLRMVDAALPAPQLQPLIRIDGRFAGRVDFYWEEFGVVGEADGLAKYDGPSPSLRDEKRRQGPMEDAGLIFVRWGWTDLSDFDPVAARLRSAFARGLRPDRAPRLWTATWYSGRAVG